MNSQDKVLLQIRDKVVSLWEPPTELSILAWAELYREVAHGTSSRPGKFEALPHQRYVLEHLGTTYSEMIMMLPSQYGAKTETQLCVIGYYIHHDPSNILIKYPTEKAAAAFSTAKLAPMIEATPVLRKCVRVAKGRDSGNTIMSKTYTGGSLDLTGAESPSSLRGRTKRVISQDEIDADEESSEGSAVALADKRAITYGATAVKLKTSTPTVVGGSAIQDAYDNSTQGKWTVECPHCKFRQYFKWGQVRWEEGKEEDAYIECANSECRKAISDEQRINAYYRTGAYVFDNPTSKIGGVWGNGITLGVIGLNTKEFKTFLHQWVMEFKAAKKGGSSTLQVWVNTFLCECWEEEAVSISPDPIKLRAETYTHEVPEGVVYLTAAVDIQPDRVEAEIVGHGENDQTWGIGYKVCTGDPRTTNVMELMHEWLQDPRTHASGAIMRPAIVAFDTGHLNSVVYPFIQKHSSLNYIAVKGSSVAGSQLFSIPKKTAVRRVKLTMVGTDTAKGLVYSRLKVDDIEASGYCHFPKGRGYDDEFYAQLTAEKVTNKYAHGKKIQVWSKKRERNEALDIRVYNLAAFALAVARYGVRINKLVEACKAQMEELRKEKTEPEEKDDALPVATDSAAATATPVAPAEPAEVAKLDEGRPLKAKANAFAKPKRKLMSFSLL